MSTSVFVCTHVKTQVPEDSTYKLLQVNAEVNGRFGDEYYYDNDGDDNISRLNCYFGELTGLYWIYRNYPGDENIGICHYRRFFVDDHMNRLTGDRFDEILADHDIIVPRAHFAEISYRDTYSRSHNVNDLDAVGGAVKKLYPDYYNAFCDAMNGKKYYFGNLLVTSRQLFDEYCEFLFSVLFEASENIHPDEYQDLYTRRVYGFLSENMIMAFILARQLKVYECDIAYYGLKDETNKLLLAVSQLIKNGKKSDAWDMMQSVTNIRPDVTLPASDLNNDLMMAEQGLCIAIREAERSDGARSIFSLSTDLKEMNIAYRKLYEIMQNISKGAAIDTQYLNKISCTCEAFDVIMANDPYKRFHQPPLDASKILEFCKGYFL